MMWYLFLQIWVWVVLAFVFGWVSHWFLCCRNKNGDEKTLDSKAAVTTEITPAVVTDNTAKVDAQWKPQGFTSAPTEVDDLKRIKGIGSVIEETLNGLGIYQFKQIETWDSHNISWIENFLAFPGRIAREDWVEQSKTLGAGGSTEFAKRVDKGDVDYT